MSIKDITIVITSFKSENKIRFCLNSIDKQCGVINVENSNDQKYKQKIEEEFKNVKCILTGENFGYGKANNIGLKKVKTKYALILNPDTELSSDALAGFIDLANTKKNFAIIGPGIYEKRNITSSETTLTATEFKEVMVTSVKGYAMFLNFFLSSRVLGCIIAKSEFSSANLKKLVIESGKSSASGLRIKAYLVLTSFSPILLPFP